MYAKNGNCGINIFSFTKSQFEQFIITTTPEQNIKIIHHTYKSEQAGKKLTKILIDWLKKDARDKANKYKKTDNH